MSIIRRFRALLERARRRPAHEATPDGAAEARTKRRRPRSLLRSVLAGSAVLGLGVALTAAAWTESVTFQGATNVRASRMQYSFDYTNWRPFPGTTLTLSQWPATVNPGGTAGTHSVFVRNGLNEASTVAFTPALTGVLAQAGFMSIRIGLNGTAQQMETSMQPWTSGTMNVSIDAGPGARAARIDLSYNPAALTPSATERTGTLSVQIAANSVAAPAAAQLDDAVAVAPPTDRRAVASRRNRVAA